jgi:hypothetical protein
MFEIFNYFEHAIFKGLYTCYLNVNILYNVLYKLSIEGLCEHRKVYIHVHFVLVLIIHLKIQC